MSMHVLARPRGSKASLLYTASSRTVRATKKKKDRVPVCVSERISKKEDTLLP